jgi:hypothetical protein
MAIVKSMLTLASQNMSSDLSNVLHKCKPKFSHDANSSYTQCHRCEFVEFADGKWKRALFLGLLCVQKEIFGVEPSTI